MDIDRAQEIFNSKGVIDVDYNGKSVWIKSLDKENQTAEVEIINKTKESQVVNVGELTED